MNTLIAAYDDNPDYGGHQVMSAYGIESLCSDPGMRLVFFCNPANEKLVARLREIDDRFGNLEIRKAPLVTRKFQGLLNPLCGKLISRLADELRELNPCMMLCIQGDIEDSSQGILAANQAGISCLSYIPVPHPLALMGAKLGRLRDMVNRYLFNRPDGFITISNTMKQLLVERGCKKPILVVLNGIDVDRFHAVPREEARRGLGLPLNRYIIGQVGRVEFKQKQQDFTLRAMVRYPDVFENSHIAFVGDGPDRAALEKLAKDLKMDDRVTFFSWMDDPSQVYSAMDILVLPSRFEGVPLVMLEALCTGIPVLGSCRDGMKDILPEDWLFPAENEAEFAKTLEYMRENAQKTMPQLEKSVRKIMNLDAFKAAFHDTVKAWTNTTR